MIEYLMERQRKQTIAFLACLCGFVLLLWLIRGPRPLSSNLPFLAVSMLLTPLAFLGAYGILYLNIRVNRISDTSFRRLCAIFFVGASFFLAISALYAVARFVTHRPLPPANFLALGVVLGAMKAWDLEVSET